MLIVAYSNTRSIRHGPVKLLLSATVAGAVHPKKSKKLEKFSLQSYQIGRENSNIQIFSTKNIFRSQPAQREKFWKILLEKNTGRIRMPIEYTLYLSD